MSDLTDDQSVVDDYAALPEKFKDVPSLVKSYTELESAYGRVITDRKAIEDQLAESEQALTQMAAQFDAAAAGDFADRSPQLTVAELVAMNNRFVEEGAQRVAQALTTGKVEAPEDMGTLTSILPGVMAQHDPHWMHTPPELVAQVIADRPELLPERMDNMSEITNGLSAAAEIARGRQAEANLDAYRRAEESAQMKINAQTLSGAAGRPEAPDDDEEFFGRLKNAARGNWSSRRR